MEVQFSAERNNWIDWNKWKDKWWSGAGWSEIKSIINEGRIWVDGVNSGDNIDLKLMVIHITVVIMVKERIKMM